MLSSMGAHHSYNDMVTSACRAHHAPGVATIRAWQESLCTHGLICSACPLAVQVTCRGRWLCDARAGRSRDLGSRGALLRLWRRRRRTCKWRDLCRAGSGYYCVGRAGLHLSIALLLSISRALSAHDFINNTAVNTWGRDTALTLGKCNCSWMHCSTSALQRRTRLLGC